ncbi:MAG: hypothetical protein CTY19_03225 [Methylomonas sp.]|jgi:predicted SAM-dependent methyltransferase|nr:MAG: hypothetical protein CTY19_03225 [Methylomonas sp.]
MIDNTYLKAKFYVRQFIGRILRIVNPKPIPEGEYYIHLGCGHIDHPGFINIDGIDYPHVHFVQSITNLKQFKDNSIKFIYSSHTLEHFPRSQTLAILREWLRALQPQGKLCLSVPDFDLIINIYREQNNNVNFILPPLFGGQDYPFNFHFTTFNNVSLTNILLEAGFKTVEEWTFGKDHLHSLPDWSGRYITVADKKMPISLNLEATK